MRPQRLLLDIAVGLAAGLVATKMTEFVQEASYKLMPKRVKEREDEVRPGPPPKIAARKTAEALGFELDEKQLMPAAMVVHYGLGLAWGPVYTLLRRHSQMEPLGAGFITGAAMSLIADEALPPALGFTAPSHDYPTLTHVRGFANHLVYGAIAAVAAETIYHLTDTLPEKTQAWIDSSAHPRTDASDASF